MPERKPENADLWSAIRGLGMTRKTSAELRELIAAHKDNPAFASRVISEAARQVIAGKLNRIADQ